MGEQNIERAFLNIKERGDKAFVPYIMAGDGGLAKLQENITFLDKAGATLVEIGIPFSDPVADGPTIQRAGKRALDGGTTLDGIFRALQEVRPNVTLPFVLMTYMNPIFAYGIERFMAKCQEAGVDGLIVPDLPYEEKGILTEAMRGKLALIPLVTLTSPLERITKIVKEGQGFIYAVTVTGVTGARREFQESLFTYLKQVKELSSLPVLAGFGISSPDQIKLMDDVTDGVVIGSRIIELLEQGKYEEIEALIHATKHVM